MRGSVSQLQIINILDCLNVVSTVVEQRQLTETRPQRRLEDIPSVLDGITIGNPVAIKHRNGRLKHSQFLEKKLNNDFGVEVEIVSVFLERNLSQRSG